MAAPTLAQQVKAQSRQGSAVTLLPVVTGALGSAASSEVTTDSAAQLYGFDHYSDTNQLQAAFESFNVLSQQLTESYQVLEAQVSELTAELAHSQQSRANEEAAKERVTGRLEGLLSALPVGVVVLDVRGRVQECNPAAVDLLGEPLEGQPWLEVIQRVFSPRFDDGHEVSLKDGRRVSIATRSLEGEPGQLIVLTDMTETRALQEHLSRHERLSALGKMVASLAHQIRTPLSAAMLYGEHLVSSELTVLQQQRFASKLMSRLNHLEQQVRDMLIFAKGDTPLENKITTEQLVSGLEAAMEVPLAKTHSLCVLENNAAGHQLQCNTEALVGAILNLVNNAIEVVGQGAVIHIELGVIVKTLLRIRVTDQGPGIPEHLKASVREAFVTTKSQGTGLGLSIVQGVVKAHHGEFVINSDVERGVEMTLLLPLAAQHDVEEQL